jgi:hypothetical protein
VIEFFSAEHLYDTLRPALQHRLDVAIDAGHWDEAADVLAALIDTWPISATVETAWVRWCAEREPLALSILGRAREIMALMGAPSADIPLAETMPAHETIPGEDLAARRAELCGKAADGALGAVVFSSPVPMEAEAQLALGELRMEAPAQAAVEAHGLAGLLAPGAPTWAHAFGPAPAGRMGDALRLLCDVAILPGTPDRLRGGDPSPIGWLLWSGPAAPVAVAPGAIELLRHVHEGVDAAFAAAGFDAEQGREALTELVELGALDCA